VGRHGKTIGLLAWIVAIIALVGAVFAVVNQVQIAGPRDERIAEQDALILRLTGLANDKSTNTLDARYTDSDGDLVADAPKNMGDLIDPPVIKFSYVATENSDEFKQAFAPVLAAITKATGKPCEYVEYDAVEDQLRAIRAGELHVAGLGTGAVPIGVCAAGFVPVAQMADATGAAGYQMEIIVPSKSPMMRVTDLRAASGADLHELALTEPTSNSGYKAPLVVLRENGLVPGRDYRIRYTQGHVTSIAGIKSGAYEAAAVANDVLKRQVASGVLTESDYRPIFKSENTFPTAALGYAHQLKPELADKIRAALLGFDWKGTELEKSFGQEGKAKFIAVNYQKDWEYVRRIDESIGFSYALSIDQAPTTAPASVTTTGK